MSNLHVFPDLGRSREEAATWLARIDRGLAPDERTAFDTWRANPANSRALGDMSGLWNDMDELRVLAEVIPPRDQHVRAGNSRRYAAAIAASIFAGLLAVGVYLMRGSGNPATGTQSATAQQFTTAVGEQRSIALEDGSVIALNTDSAVEVALGQDSRELQLVRGEAHFTVAHDAARPFRVRVDGRTVQAVGTAFDVRLHGDAGIEVIVTEGRVQVLGRDRPLLESLDRGQAAWIGIGNDLRIQHLDGEALTTRLAWRNGMLIFDGESLGEALQEFARYTTDRFSVSDPVLLQQRIGGYFPTGDTDALIDALRENFGFEVQRGQDGEIRIGPGRESIARSGTD